MRLKRTARSDSDIPAYLALNALLVVYRMFTLVQEASPHLAATAGGCVLLLASALIFATYVKGRKPLIAVAIGYLLLSVTVVVLAIGHIETGIDWFAFLGTSLGCGLIVGWRIEDVVGEESLRGKLDGA